MAELTIRSSGRREERTLESSILVPRFNTVKAGLDLAVTQFDYGDSEQLLALKRQK